MTAALKLRAVLAPDLKPRRRCSVRAEWAHPYSASHQARYRAAIRFLRKGGRAKWLMDIYAEKKT